MDGRRRSKFAKISIEIAEWERKETGEEFSKVTVGLEQLHEFPKNPASPRKQWYITQSSVRTFSPFKLSPPPILGIGTSTLHATLPIYRTQRET